VGILNQRIEALGKGRIARAVVGDYQDADGICAILNDLPPKCLNLVFIDPTECNVPFSTIERIVQHLKKADLIINVAIGTDVNRNLVQAITSPAFATVRTKYEEFLGVPDFCSRPEIRELAERADYDDLRRAFAECYRQQLQKLGYHYTDSKPVKHYYHLVFASKDPKGLDFWQKACSIDPHNQRQLL
jgi:three-Cys-motif partner protein